MEFLESWITAVVAAALILAAVCSLAPEGQAKRAVRLAGGACVFLAVFLPLTGADFDELSLSAAVDADYADAAAELERTNRDLQKIIIDERLSSYISQKADALGLEVSVELSFSEREGVPLPDGVRCEYSGSAEAAGELSRCIESELGIPASAQRFSERLP